jgi:hypothetical protein
MIGAAGCGIGSMATEVSCAYSGAVFQTAIQQPFEGHILPCGCDKRKRLMWSGGVMDVTPPIIPNEAVIVHIFNQHVCAIPQEVAAGVKKWSIEQLAEWLDTLEPKDPEQPADPEVPDSKPEVPIEEGELVYV